MTLAFAILIPVFTLCALVLCIRTKMEKRKWLWIIFIIIGSSEKFVLRVYPLGGPIEAEVRWWLAAAPGAKLAGSYV